jgi:phosphate transport system permease protein
MAPWRHFKDRTATITISAGGGAVLMAILLIFFYLVYEILPLFGAAGIELSGQQQIQLTQGTEAAYIAVEEQGEMSLVVETGGHARFVDLASGATALQLPLRTSDTVALTVVSAESAESRLLGLGYADGSVLLASHEYLLTYPDDKRFITPRIDYPYGTEPIQIATDGAALTRLALRDTEEGLVIAAQSARGQLSVVRYTKEENFLSGEIELEREELSLDVPRREYAALYLGTDQRWLYLLDKAGHYQVVDLKRQDESGTQQMVDEGRLFDDGSELSSSSMLLGGISLLAASATGELSQYFMVRDGQQQALHKIRSFDTEGARLLQLLPEQRRKGFLALDASGQLQIFHTTGQRKLLHEGVDYQSGQAAAIAPRADSLLLLDQSGGIRQWHIENEHPEISWSALWSKVWYESYPEPEYTWQSSSSSNDFEPKYSFAPLAFGTLKAAFYAMLIAAPLAICGAIYTAYFMAPALRRKIKPLIELMEALPTVILGFLAGLWLAPFVESNLTGVFSVLLLMPVGILGFAFIWSRLPVNLRTLVPDGWHAAILIPVVCLVTWLCFALNDSIELLLFNGDMRAWITQDLGISFDQRNALVVGIAMGMAVIPTIFSISEDAIFAVPKHLSYGSLALGATPWQTLVGVVIPTASPGIFSGLMIGLGRAVGETMIVLMATGNTPIMDANIFEGMRTLAANIAVEVPEAEVDSSHFRILFLAAFVLFIFTFVVNTIAEVIRQRLRVKYGSL